MAMDSNRRICDNMDTDVNGNLLIILRNIELKCSSSLRSAIENAKARSHVSREISDVFPRVFRRSKSVAFSSHRRTAAAIASARAEMAVLSNAGMSADDAAIVESKLVFGFLRLPGDIESPPPLSSPDAFFFFDEEDKDRASSSCDFKSLMTSSTVSRSKSGLALKSISHNLENTVIKTPGVVAIPSIARVHTFGNGPASSWPTPYNDSPACASKADLDCCPPVPRSPMSRFVSSPLAAAKEYKSFSDNSRMFSKSVFTASTSI
mmetsp:Transcript_2048/g.6253  ORF Transcript_2048/g.6253 Transcript_2048/m.6253 type:complete len:264 (+) Transcript_2048:1351-2142(+)